MVDKHQYNIEQKLSSKENRIAKNVAVLVHFKLTEKLNSNVSYMESWLVSTERASVSFKSANIDYD